MREIQGKSILVRVSARFELSRVDCIFISQKSVNLWLPFVFSFLFKHSSVHHFTILPIFYFSRQNLVGGGEFAIFSFGQEGGLSKNSV